MHRLLIAPALLLLAACAGSPDARSADRAGAPRGPACLDPNTVRTWHNDQGEVIYVDAGRHKYRIDLMQNCFPLGNDARMGFQGDAITGRVCGNYSDRIVLQHATCRIRQVSLIDEQTYARATGAADDEADGDDAR